MIRVTIASLIIYFTNVIVKYIVLVITLTIGIIMLPKYCEERQSKKSGKYWIHNPPKKMRDLLNIQNRNFYDYDELCKYAAICFENLQDALRKQNGVHVDQFSVRGLVEYYKETSYFIKLKPNSKESYNDLFKFGLNFVVRGSNKSMGEYPYKTIDRAFVDRLNVCVREQNGVHRVFHLNKVMRRVFNVAIKHEKITYNPFTMQELTPPKNRKVIWTTEYLKKFVDTADKIGYSSIGTVALFCFHLSQRPGDIRQLKVKNLNDGILTFTQEKSITCKGGEPVTLSFDLTIKPLQPLLDRLQKVGTDFSNPENNLIVYETTKRGITSYNCIHATQVVRKKANLPQELQMRYFRATGATNLGLAGCSTNELMSITGHKDPKTVQIYLRKAEEMRANAFAKLATNHNIS